MVIAHLCSAETPDSRWMCTPTFCVDICSRWDGSDSEGYVTPPTSPAQFHRPVPGTPPPLGHPSHPPLPTPPIDGSEQDTDRFSGGYSTPTHSPDQPSTAHPPTSPPSSPPTPSQASDSPPLADCFLVSTPPSLTSDPPPQASNPPPQTSDPPYQTSDTHPQSSDPPPQASNPPSLTGSFPVDQSTTSDGSPSAHPGAGPSASLCSRTDQPSHSLSTTADQTTSVPAPSPMTRVLSASDLPALMRVLGNAAHYTCQLGIQLGLDLNLVHTLEKQARGELSDFLSRVLETRLAQTTPLSLQVLLNTISRPPIDDEDLAWRLEQSFM